MANAKVKWLNTFSDIIFQKGRNYILFHELFFIFLQFLLALMELRIKVKLASIVEDPVDRAQAAMMEFIIKTRIKLTVEDHVKHAQLVMTEFRIKMRLRQTAGDHVERAQLAMIKFKIKVKLASIAEDHVSRLAVRKQLHCNNHEYDNHILSGNTISFNINYKIQNCAALMEDLNNTRITLGMVMYVETGTSVLQFALQGAKKVLNHIACEMVLLVV